MKLVASGCPWSESAASCRPAIHPSVRDSRVATSSAERLRPIVWLRNLAASDGVKRKSVTRSSDKLPPPRSRARENCGSSRVAMTRRIWGGRCSSRKVRTVSTGLVSITW